MSGSTATSDQDRNNMPDVPIIIEDLLSQLEFQAANTSSTPQATAVGISQVHG